MTWLPFAQWGEYEELHNHQAPVVQPLDSAIQRLNNQGQDNPWGGGGSHMEQTEMLVGNFGFNP